MFSFLNRNNKEILSLNELREFLNNIENINYGGCAISAYSIYCYLEKTNQLLLDTKIIYIHRKYDIDGYNNNCSFINNGCNSLECDSASHVILYHNGYYLDSNLKQNNIKDFINEFYEFCSYDEFITLEIPQHLTHIFLKKSLNEGSWNPDFNRKNIEIIEKKLDLKLNI